MNATATVVAAFVLATPAAAQAPAWQPEETLREVAQRLLRGL